MYVARRREDRQRRSGQTLVLFALGLVAFIGMVGLVIDGGNAFAQQRRTQNGTDAAAEAGATELARRAIGLPGSDAQWDARVNQAITDSSTYNELTVNGTPQYTDFSGTALGPVNSGSIPANASGVAVNGDRNFRTFIAGAIGLSNFTASASATARTGFVKTISANGLIPLTFPVMLEQCQSGGGSNRLILPPYGATASHAWPYGPNNMVALPFCSNGPGNIGWIDWTPPAGGASEVSASILTPNSPAITVSHWYNISQTGAITSLDAAMNTWEGRDIYLPIFHVEVATPLTNPPVPSLIGTCNATPGGSQDLLSDCPAANVGGNGSNQWYYLDAFASFHLVHSYIANNHQVECNDPSLASTATYNAAAVTGGSLLNNCLIGYFNQAVVAGGEVSLTAPSSEFHMQGVQLIK